MRILTIMAVLFSSIASAQFTDKGGKQVSECDCFDPVDHLDFTAQLPANYKDYDYIQFVAYRNGTGLSTRTYRPSDFASATVTLNILNSANKAMRTLFGQEYGRSHGTDFTRTSFNSLCEYAAAVNLQIIAYGISQIGTEIVHEINDARTRITSRAVAIYDDGVEIVKSDKLNFKVDADHVKRL